jgi:hypothetical protein
VKAYRFGCEELRAVARAIDNCNETFLQRWSVDQLVQIHRMWIASGWDFTPDQWTEGQVQAALAGKVPQWDAKTEEPIEESAGDALIMATTRAAEAGAYVVQEAVAESSLIEGKTARLQVRHYVVSVERFEALKKAVKVWQDAGEAFVASINEETLKNG